MQTFRLRSLRAYLFLAGAAVVITAAVAVLAGSGGVASAHTSRVLVNDSKRLATVSPAIPHSSNDVRTRSRTERTRPSRPRSAARR